MQNNLYLWSEIVGIDPPMKGDVPTLSHFLFWYIILINGTMKTIQLSQGKVALVDDEDYNYLNQWRWIAVKCRNTYYAQIGGGNGIKVGKGRMHREIMKIPKSIKIVHIDGNGLNCQRNNMSACTQKEIVINSNAKILQEKGRINIGVCSICKSKKRVQFHNQYGNYLCGKHLNQIHRNGRILHRTALDLNEIIVIEDHAELIIYDRNNNEKCRAFIDIEDVDRVSKYKWCTDGRGYGHNEKVGKLHRFILNIKDSEIHIDHRNRIKLDCRKANLRQVTRSLNLLNAKKSICNTSGVVGVQWNKDRKKWIATIQINGEVIRLGAYYDMQGAIRARKEAEERLLPIDIYPR